MKTAHARQSELAIAEAELLLGIILQHASAPIEAYRMVSAGYRRMLECGSPFGIASAGVVYAGLTLEKGGLDESVGILESARRVLETDGCQRAFTWVLYGEALQYEAVGDYYRAKEVLEQIRDLGPEVGGHSVVAGANDRLLLVDCKLQEFDTAATAMARASRYRRSLGTVASLYEKDQTARAVQAVFERLSPEDLKAAYRRAALV